VETQSRTGNGPTREFSLPGWFAYKETTQMLRKCFAALVALMLVVGGLFAEEIKGIFKKFEDGKVTITVEEKDKTYTVDKDAKQKAKKDDILVSDYLGKLKDGDKVTLTVDGDKVTKAKKEKK
jgi:hypothetical protein